MSSDNELLDLSDGLFSDGEHLSENEEAMEVEEAPEAHSEPERESGRVRPGAKKVIYIL